MPSWQVEPARRESTWLAFRQVAPDTAPLFHAAGERSPSQRSGRWHREGEGYAQYLALEPAGSWAELVRYERIRFDPRAQEYTRRLWLVAIDESEIADLASFQDFVDCGLDPRLAVGDHGPSQSLADELRSHGYRGVLAPSAALSGATNLTLFGERYEKVLMTRPEEWDNPTPQLRLACSLVAESPPPSALITETCFVGMEHEGYRNFLRSANLPLPRDAP